jgi:putative transposase
MSHSYCSNRIHLVFSTKNREKNLSPQIQEKLWPYMAGIARNHDFEAIKIGGVEDHAHTLLLLPATVPLAKAIHHAKRNFEEEFVALLKKYKVNYDPAHVLG